MLKKILYLCFCLLIIISCQLPFSKDIEPLPISLKWSEGNIVFISDRNPDKLGWFGPLYFLDIESKYWAPLQNSQNHHSYGFAPAWDADGESLAFLGFVQSQKDYKTIFLHSDGIQTVFGTSKRFATVWSPNGKYLAFYTDKRSLNITTRDGLTEQTLVSNLPEQFYKENGEVLEGRIAWSSNGQYIAYDSINTQENKSIWVVASTIGSIPYQLTIGSHPTWSPVGNEIAFDRNGDVWVIDVENNQEVLLVDQTLSTPVGGFSPKVHYNVLTGWPTWSPSATQIVFVSGRDGNLELYLINRDGTGLENLTQHPANDVFPSWRP